MNSLFALKMAVLCCGVRWSCSGCTSADIPADINMSNVWTIQKIRFLVIWLFVDYMCGRLSQIPAREQIYYFSYLSQTISHRVSRFPELAPLSSCRDTLLHFIYGLTIFRRFSSILLAESSDPTHADNMDDIQ